MFDFFGVNFFQTLHTENSAFFKSKLRCKTFLTKLRPSPALTTNSYDLIIYKLQTIGRPQLYRCLQA